MLRCFRRFSSSAVAKQNLRIRNIGVAAHVDAGKTTVSERFLFFANKTMGLGEVHDGAATMDFLPQEQERGITINSAAISFQWTSPSVPGEFRINLVDTPGHFDFTTEVERSLRVLDGAVICFDSVEGVEAQTETVWKQADRYQVPRIAFANKMDRNGASLDLVERSMKQRLKTVPLRIHHPVGEFGEFRGVVDVITCERFVWEERGGESQGREFTSSVMSTLPEAAMATRKRVFELLADLDDVFAEMFLMEYECSTDCKHVKLNLEAKSAIRRLTCSQLAVPLLCGSALRNMGIQLVLNAVVDYLPSPLERPMSPFNSSKTAKSLLGFVFKIQHDPLRGSLAYIRLYKGKLKNRDQVRVVGRNTKEKIQGLFQAEAKTLEPFPSGEASTGDICVLVGCGNLHTGDTLGDSVEGLPGLKINPPVFQVAIELPSLSMEPKFLEAISIMIRDDPSLVFENDQSSGQFLLSGIGELHLEVSLDRLKREHGVRVSTSPPRVSLRETLVQPGEHSYLLDRMLNGTKQYCHIKLAVVVATPGEFQDGDNQVQFAPELVPPPLERKSSSSKKSTHHSAVTPLLSPAVVSAVESGVLGALSRGPLRGFPLRGVHVICQELDFGKVEDLGAIRFASLACMQHLCSTVCEAKLLEPFFAIEIVLPDAYLGEVLNDLSGRRRGEILSAESLGGGDEGRSLIRARVPAQELLSYSKTLRSLAQGHASYAAVFDQYSLCPDKNE